MTFSQLFVAGLTDDFTALFVGPILVSAFFLLMRIWFTKWPAACVAIGVWAMLPGIFFDRGSILPNLALGAGLTLANHEMGRLALRRLTRPIAGDLARSLLEIPCAIPGGQLRVQDERLLLDLDRHTQTSLLVKELRGVVVEHVHEPTTWQPTHLTKVDVPAGPVLRLTTKATEWLLPVDEQDGAALVAIIVARARRLGIKRLG